MATPICNWITPPGIRRTGGTDVIRCLVAARAVGGVDDVTFAISVNGGASSDTVVTDRAIWQPDFSDYDDPVMGVGEGQAAVYAYGVELDMATLANGYIDVTPTVTPTTGSPVTMPTHRYYNNKTTDTRPTTLQIYMSPTGSDSNNGLTSGAPVLSPNKAMSLAVTGGYLGGAEILMMAGDHDWVQGLWWDSPKTGPTDSDCFYCTFKPAPGVTRAEVRIVEEGVSDVEMKSAEKFRIKFENVTFAGNSANSTGSGNDLITFWYDHCHFVPYDPAYGPGEPHPHVEAIVQTCCGANAQQSAIELLMYTGCTWEDLPSSGLTNINGPRGIFHGNLFLNNSGSCVYPHGADVFIGSNKVQGVRGNRALIGNTSYTGTMSIIESPVHAGKVRVIVGSVTSNIDNPVSGINTLVDAATALIGATWWGLDLRGFTTHAAGSYAPLGAGNNGSNDWVDLDLSYISDETAAGSRTLETTAIQDIAGGAHTGSVCSIRTSYINAVHENGIFYTDANPVSNCTVALNHAVGNYLYAGLRIDTDGSGNNCTRNCWEGNVGMRCDVDVTGGTPTISDLIIDRNSMSALLMTSACTLTDIEITNNIFGSIGYIDGNKATLEGKLSSTNVHHNHFVVTADEWSIGSAGNTVGGGANPFTAGTFVQADAAGNWAVASGSTAFGAASSAAAPAPWATTDQGAYGPGLDGDWLVGAGAAIDVSVWMTGLLPVMAASLGVNILMHQVASAQTGLLPTMAAAVTVGHGVASAQTGLLPVMAAVVAVNYDSASGGAGFLIQQQRTRLRAARRMLRI